MAVIKISNLNKSYGDKTVLNNISLTFEENKIYGLLGRNGAGKTTLLNIITDRIKRNSGEVTIDGEDVSENDNALGKIYYITEQTLYPEDFKVKDIFKWTAEFYPNFNMEYAKELSSKFELNINKKIKQLSTGYGSICKNIVAMASGAEVTIFDEPILGLDANHRELFYKLLMEDYIEHPKTIILSTHIIGEVAKLLEDVVIINNGKVITTEDSEELLDKAYTVSGQENRVDKYIEGKTVINVEKMASFKSASIMGAITEEDRRLAKDLELEISKVELQKLFIMLTEKEVL